MAMRRSTKMQLAKAAREQSQQMPGRKLEIEYERWGQPEDNYGRETQQRYGGENRSNWREPVHMGGYGPENREGRMEYGGTRSNWDEDMEMRRGRSRGARSEMETEMRRGGGARSEMDMEGDYGAESRFRDRRGREHYDNGRFAPMAGGYGPYAAGYEGPFGRDARGGEDMRQIGFNANWNPEMRMGSDASMPRYNEMDHMPGRSPMMGGYMAGAQEYPKMDERTAMEWVQSMQNEDGTKGPHWSMEQVKQVIKQKSLNLDPVEAFAIMNAIYSDYEPVLKKHGVSTIDMYVDMTKAWLMDKDAVHNKATAYYECIAKK